MGSLSPVNTGASCPPLPPGAVPELRCPGAMGRCSGRAGRPLPGSSLRLSEKRHGHEKCWFHGVQCGFHVVLRWVLCGFNVVWWLINDCIVIVKATQMEVSWEFNVYMEFHGDMMGDHGRFTDYVNLSKYQSTPIGWDMSDRLVVVWSWWWLCSCHGDDGDDGGDDDGSCTASPCVPELIANIHNICADRTPQKKHVWLCYRLVTIYRYIYIYN